MEIFYLVYIIISRIFYWAIIVIACILFSSAYIDDVINWLGTLFCTKKQTQKNKQQTEFCHKCLQKIVPAEQGCKITLGGGDISIKNAPKKTQFSIGQDNAQLISGEFYYKHIIKTSNCTIEIDRTFLYVRSEEFVNILNLWDEYNQNKKIKVDMSAPIRRVIHHQGKFYIVVSMDRKSSPNGKIEGVIPTCLFRYDILIDKVEYLGYYDNLNYSVKDDLYITLPKQPIEE